MTRSAPVIRPVPHRHRPLRPRIAVGTDGSTWGETALDWALRHAAGHDGQVNVFAAECTDDQAITRRLEGYRWLFTSVVVSPASPVKILVNTSREHDLLVLGYRGRGHGPFGLGRSVLPVVSAAHCDIVVVRGETRAVQGEYRSVTAAVGGSDDDLVVRRAAQYAVRSRSRLRLVHAAPLPGAHQVPEAVDPSEVLVQARDAVREVTADLVPSLHLVRSRPHEAVRTCTRTDLLVMGAGRGRLSPITSTALHIAPCPVLVVKRPEGRPRQARQ